MPSDSIAVLISSDVHTQQVGDFDVRQQRVGLPYQGLGFFRNSACYGRYFEDTIDKIGVGQFVARGELIDFLQFMA